MNIIYLKVPTNKSGKSYISIGLIQKWSKLIEENIEEYYTKQQIEHNLIVVSNSLEIENPLQKYHSSMYNDDKLKIINLQVPIVKGTKILDSFAIRPAEIPNFIQIFKSRIDNQWEYVVVATPFEIKVSGNNKAINIPCKVYDDEEIKEIIKQWDLD